jgi:pyruvate dehydrogenase E1 component beta subunit
VITPAFPDDAKGLLKSAIRSNNPVCFIENEKLYGFKDEVPEGEILTTIGQARIRRPGDQVTLIANSASTHVALAAALQLESDGISAEVLDLRTIKPLDLPAILGSVAKTNRVVIVEENKPFAGWGAQVAYEIQHRSFDDLDAPIQRVTGLDTPQPYARVLEQAVMPSADRVIEAVKKILA